MLATTSPTNADNIVGSVKTPCRSLKYCDFREKHEKWGWLSPFPINHWKVWKQCSAWWNYRLESTSHSPHIPEFNDTFFPLPTFSSIIAFACCQSHNVFSYKKKNNFNIAKAGNVTLTGLCPILTHENTNTMWNVTLSERWLCLKWTLAMSTEQVQARNKPQQEELDFCIPNSA